MSDYSYDPSTDPYGLSDAELMDYILNSSANGGVYGKDPSARLTTLSKMQGLLNGPLLTSMFPSETIMDPTTVPEPTLAPNLQRQVYGNNPLFKSLFDTMDSGADPLSAISAIEQAVKEGKFEGVTPDVLERQKEQILKVATDYGMESYKNLNTYNEDVLKAQTNATNPDDQYYMSNGTKYKGSNLGRGTMGMANEFDLLGAPSTEEAKRQLMDQYAASHPSQHSPKVPVPQAGNWSPEDDQIKTTVDSVLNDVFSKAETAKKFVHNKTADFLVKERLDKAKNTNVRSEANRQMAYKILALRSLAGA